MSDPGFRHALRRAIETVVPWFDRSEQDRHRVALERDIAVSRAVRARATRTLATSRQEVLRESFGRAGERLVP